MKETTGAWLIVFLAALLLLPPGGSGPLAGFTVSSQKEMGPLKNGGNPGTLSDVEIERVAKIQSRHEKEIMRLTGVQGIGIGMRDRQSAFLVLVDKNLPRPVIPAQIEGVPTQIKLVDKIIAHNGGCGCVGPPRCHSDQVPLPTTMGTSTSDDQSCYSCTLGFVACRNGVRGYVTNHHCNRDANCESTGTFNHYERSRGDNGCNLASLIGTTGYVAPFSSNVDASFIASSALQSSPMTRDINLAPSTRPGNPTLDQCIQKVGRTSGRTFGRIIGVNVSVNVSGYCAGIIGFPGQVVYQADAACGTCENGDCVVSVSGDSGSPVLDLNNQIVALNFAGGGDCAAPANNVGVGNPIASVLSALNAVLGESCAPATGCCVTMAVAGTPQETSTLATFYEFRDQVLSQTPKGREYIRLYYDNSAEATALMLRNLGLLLGVRQMIGRFTPVARDMVAGKPVIVTQRDLNDVDQFLNTISDLRVSQKFRSAIDRVRRDLQDPGIQAQFSVGVSH